MTQTMMIVLGLVTGVFAGLFGLGGGIILIPMLVLLMKYPQQTASGTSLVAMLLPVGIFGVMEYYKAGKISMDNIKIGLFIAIGLMIGTYFGAKIATYTPEFILRRLFSIALVLAAIKMWLK